MSVFQSNDVRYVQPFDGPLYSDSNVVYQWVANDTADEFLQDGTLLQSRFAPSQLTLTRLRISSAIVEETDFGLMQRELQLLEDDLLLQGLEPWDRDTKMVTLNFGFDESFIEIRALANQVI